MQKTLLHVGIRLKMEDTCQRELESPKSPASWGGLVTESLRGTKTGMWQKTPQVGDAGLVSFRKVALHPWLRYPLPRATAMAGTSPRRETQGWTGIWKGTPAPVLSLMILLSHGCFFPRAFPSPAHKLSWSDSITWWPLALWPKVFHKCLASTRPGWSEHHWGDVKASQSWKKKCRAGLEGIR